MMERVLGTSNSKAVDRWTLAKHTAAINHAVIKRLALTSIVLGIFVNDAVEMVGE